MLPKAQDCYKAFAKEGQGGSATMKTMVLSHYNRPLEVNDREIPRIESGEVLLKVKACGICQTDLKIIEGAIPPPVQRLHQHDRRLSEPG